MRKKDYRFFNSARKEAQLSDYKNIHIGCVIVYKGHIIGQGHNSNKTDPMQKEYNKYRKFNRTVKGSMIKHSLHSEINAIKSIPITLYDSIDWKKVDLYVFRISPGKDLGQGLARPCSACMKAIRDLGIQNIYYTTDDGYCYERIF